MSCNSCSNITLPGVAGPQGPQGPQGVAGTNGTNGTNGIDGADGADGVNGVSIIEVDTAQGALSSSAIGTTNQTSDTTYRDFTIAANTWETVDDIVELELMLVGEGYDAVNAWHKLWVKIDGINVDLGLPGYVIAPSRMSPFMYLKIQFVLSDAATPKIIPIADYSYQYGDYTNLSSIGNTSSSDYRIRGAEITLSNPISGAIDISVSPVSANASATVNLFYAKLTSYKK